MANEAWETVRDALEKEDAPVVAALLGGYDPAQRQEVARELPRYLRARRYGYGGWIEAMRVAGAAAIGGAAAVAAWLHRQEFQSWDERDDVSLIAEAIADRPERWRSDLAVRLARRSTGPRPEGDRDTRLALELLRSTGAEPPDHDLFTVAWAVLAARDPAEAPLRAVMLPRIFEADGVGRALRDEHAWPVRLAGEGPRELLLDGCLGRFLRGGSAGDLRLFVRLHQALEPAPAEVSARRRDYLRLLPAAPANVADLAVACLRRLGPLEPPDAREAVEGLLFRREGRFVRAGLTWLDHLATSPAHSEAASPAVHLVPATDLPARSGSGRERAGAGDLDDFAAGVAAAFVCAASDARERAARLVVKHATRFTPAALETIADAASLLPPGEGAELSTVLARTPLPGIEEEDGPAFRPRALPVLVEPSRVLPPQLTPSWLLRRLSAHDWYLAERWLNAFVRLAATDRAGLAAALAPAAAAFSTSRYWWHPWWDVNEWVGAMAVELAEPGTEARAGKRGALGMPTPKDRVPGFDQGAVSKIVPLARFAEVHQALIDGTLPPYLLATPTHVTGRLDADELLERLAGYQRAGVRALPLDLEQALLRLPRDISPEARERLRESVGQEAVAALAADPSVRLVWDHSDPDDVRVRPEIDAAPTGLSLLDAVIATRARDEGCAALLAVVPSRRELAAAHSVHSVVSYSARQVPRTADLTALATAQGPGGEGVAMLLAYRIWQRRDDDEVMAPLLWLAAAGELPAEEVGRQLSRLLRHGRETPTEVLPLLREAAQQGAYEAVWGIVAGLIEEYLPGPGERVNTAHVRLVSFAVDAAGWAGARGELPRVAELAGRTRTSHLVRQARRLHAQLTRQTPGRTT
ncbi:hypothetical protein HII36_24710 [Nonomuraea sp. NN258]|uniref:DUF7824 domain-containing protein n=1 Tax=Nonomuraea antri TaxID=2730852 RepID=UPI001569A9B2|nr:DUF6493 family protein [Nonomuraea antri]NRQ34999.1 hypothetical protein [Nonomuraea antri]